MNVLRNSRLFKAITMLSMWLFLLVSSSIFLTYTVFNHELKKRLTETNIELLRQLDQKLELTLQSIDKTAFQLLSDREIVHFYERGLEHGLNETTSEENLFQLHQVLKSATRSNEYIFSIDLYSYGSEQLISGNSLLGRELPIDFGWVDQFRNSDTYYSWLPTRPIPLNRANDPIYRNVVTLVRTYPIMHAPDRRKGAIAINVKEDMLYKLLRNTSDKERGQISVIDREGNVVLHADKNMIGKNIDGLDYMKPILHGAESGNYAAEIDHTPTSVFHIHSKYADWYIVRTVPEAQITQPLVMIRNGLFVLGAVLLVVAITSAALFGQWTFYPMRKLVRTLGRQRIGQARRPELRKYMDEFHYFESTVRDILSERDQLTTQLNESKPLIKWQLVMELLSGKPSQLSSIQPYLDRLGLRLYSNCFVIMCVEFDNKGEISSSRDLQLYTYALCNIAEELVSAEGLGIAVEISHGRSVIIISFEDNDAPERYTMRVLAFANVLKNLVREYLRHTVSIGIGGPVHSIKEIPLSYRQSLEALKYKLVMGINSIITHDDVDSDYYPDLYRLFAMIDGIVDCVKLLDTTKMNDRVSRWFDFFETQNVPPEMIMQLIVQCLMKAATIAVEIGVATDEVFPDRQIYSELNQYESLEHLQEFTEEALETLIRQIRNKRSQRENNEVIENIMAYIQNNYHRGELSLNLLASEFRISVSHLSKLFKEQNELNFIDYLMEVRMEKAKELLTGTDLKIREISERVGYVNVNSFVRIFKKMTGLTPTEYRSRHFSIVPSS